MKGARDKTLLIGLGIAAILFLFYFMVLGPKREKASALGDDITQLESDVEQQKQVTQFAEEARQDFPRYYGRLVVLGKAVPDQADTASLLVQVNNLATGAGVDFRGIELSEGGGSGEAAAGGSTAGTTPPAPTTPPSTEDGAPPSGESTPPASGETGSTGTPASSTTTAPAPATEATAANLPLGAVVGPAGLPTLPYEVTMRGSFFNAANFMAGLDRLVTLRESNGQVAANGRLLTVDGFALSHPTLGAVPELDIDFSLTSYATPSDQGLTAGASPGGPAPAPATPAPTPASSTGVAP